MKQAYFIWSNKIILSVADQGVASLSNFIFNIILIRTLTVDQYGIFSLGFATFLFCSGLHNAFIIEPMSVLGPVNFQGQLKSYYSLLIKYHFVLTGSISLFIWLISLILSGYSTQLAEGLLSAAISTPFILFFWLNRRACYLISKPSYGLRGSLIYSFILGLIFLLKEFNRITVLISFIVLALASLFAGIYIWHLLRKELEDQEKSILTLKIIWRSHWKYSKWIAGWSSVYWISNTATLPLLSLFGGVAQTGIFRALQNLILPLQQIGTAIGILFIPWFSAQRAQISTDLFKKRSQQILLVFGLIGILYFVGVVLFHKPLVNWLYSKKEYQDFSWLLVFLGGMAVCEALGQGLSVTFRALQKPKAMFWAQSFGAFLSLTIGLYLIKAYQVEGAAIGQLFVGLGILAVMIYQYFLLVIKQPTK